MVRKTITLNCKMKRGENLSANPMVVLRWANKIAAKASKVKVRKFILTYTNYAGLLLCNNNIWT